MLFSYNLLSQFVDLSNIKPEELIQRLTFSGLEVEESYPSAFASKVVSGHILECVNHPDSDHLHCLKVDLGPKYGVSNIVCGAPNVAKGQNVIVALPGCKLDAINEVIKPGVIRGQESNGMCCSLIELGIDKSVLPESEKEGIHILSDDVKPGDEEILKHIGIEDLVLDISVLPNRPDCLSYFGMAREIAALMKCELKDFGFDDLTKLPERIKAKSETKFCPKFDLLIGDIGDSINLDFADKIKKLLWINKINTVSPLVDFGNFMMLLTGNPFHIYDFDKVQSESFVAKTGIKGKFLALNEKEYDLIEDDIVIADDKDRPLCIAGIMGGDSSKDNEKTRKIAVEAAVFYHSNVRHTSARLGLSSASSILFGKGVNPNVCDDSISSFAFYLKKLYPNTDLTSFSSYEGEYKKPLPFEVSLEKLNHRLGTSYTKENLDEVLKAYNLEKIGNKVISPKYRTDLNEQTDIDEEVFRYFSADYVKPSYNGLPLTSGGYSANQKSVLNIKNFLYGLGLNEILTFTLISEKQAESIKCFSDEKGYKVTNPLTKDHEFVRTDLLPSMIETLQRNISYSYKNLSFFEVSDVDSPKENMSLLSIGLYGMKENQDLYGSREYDYYDLKEISDGILSILGINSSRVKLVRSTNKFFHPGKSADLYIGKDLVATFGQVSPSEFENEYLLAEFNLTLLLNVKTGNTKFTSFNQYPLVRRDLSFDILGDVEFQELVSKARKASTGYLRNVQLFDYYVNPKTGSKSLGISLFIGSNEKTLKEEEISNETSSIVSALVSNFPIVLRK